MSLYDDVVEIARDIENVKNQLDAALADSDDVEELQDAIEDAVYALSKIYDLLY